MSIKRIGIFLIVLMATPCVAYAKSGGGSGGGNSQSTSRSQAAPIKTKARFGDGFRNVARKIRGNLNATNGPQVYDGPGKGGGSGGSGSAGTGNQPGR